MLDYHIEVRGVLFGLPHHLVCYFVLKAAATLVNLVNLQNVSLRCSLIKLIPKFHSFDPLLQQPQTKEINRFVGDLIKCKPEN